ncbi:unnamed protein product [Arctia plantaginis]|uniref:Cytosolic fatty-acid binding proteins domain-containing protein n=1 Tax=Arctia plantaginis TaxID=874455 RepID=A0A8S0YS90_ARCPL|nr:unnamed protein product [Arctia plantaginis]
MDQFLGKNYVLIDSENFEDYLAFVGVSFIARKIALALKQTVRLTRNEDGGYKFHFISPLASSDFVFTPGEEFLESRPDGVTMKSFITIQDNVMTHTHTDNTGKTSKHVLVFYTDKMITTTTGEGLDKIVKRYYEAR